MGWNNPKKVVVPIDFSKESLVAVREARSVVTRASQLFILHVLLPLHSGEPGMIWGAVDFSSRQEHVLDHMRTVFQGPEFDGINLQAMEGDPGDAIALYAQKISAELILIPSHGRKGLSRLVIGSVAERVVRLAHCPVLVLRH